MNIERKIEEIRRQPENVKLRYIYALMAISLVFVLLIWFFSFFAGINLDDSAEKLKNQAILNDFESQKKSLEDVTKETKKSLDDLNKAITPENTPSEKNPPSKITPPPSN